MTSWAEIYEDLRAQGFDSTEAAKRAWSIYGNDLTKPVPKLLPVKAGEWDMADIGGVPAWVRRRQTSAANALGFEPPKRDKALPLAKEDIIDALSVSFTVMEARELDGLDVWFVLAIKAELNVFGTYEIILYEHKGEWVCSSITQQENAP